MENTDNRTKIAKLVWSKLTYTECIIDDNSTTIIEIKQPWELIKELEGLFATTVNALNFNVRQNMQLIKDNHRLHEERRQKQSEQPSNCDLPQVIKSLPEPDEIRMKARELDEKDFAQWMYEIQKGNVL